MAGNRKLFINREISWLYFNERVLQEASDPNTPLIERLKFLGIYSNNLDEFFRVRVATLKRMVSLKGKGARYLDYEPRRVLKQVNDLEKRLQRDFQATFEHLLKELERQNIFVINEKQLSETQGRFVNKYFEEYVRPHLFPIMMKNFNTTAFLKDISVYLAVDLKSSNPDTSDNIALIQLPVGTISRFLVLPEEDGRKYIMLLDDVIRFCLADIFSVFGYNAFEAFTVKFTRDAEIDIDNDVSKSFLEIMALSLKQRKAGNPVRFILDGSMPDDLFKAISKKFDITEQDSITIRGRYHNFKDFMNFPNIGDKSFEYPPAPPLRHPQLPRHSSILAAIRQKDIMLHYPYQSFHYIVDLLREASIDPKVRAIKMTLYRVAKNSNIISALINAARNGKEVIVFLELQARFDEEANIFWAERLQEEGVKVIQTIPGYKVHSKLILIRRKENDKNVYYANIGTGNFHEGTARVYADEGLLTANEAITSDVNKVFHLLEEKYNPPNFKKLLVAPFQMRNHFLRLINKEMQHAKAGKDAWMILKMNSLVDEKIIEKLYRASQAGVKIKLIVRGICVLTPGIAGVSDNIEAISIVDKFLEHSRVFVFGNNKQPKYYISSADWMVRNFDYRIEVACPVEDPDIQEELMKMLRIQLADNSKARIISREKPNKYKKAKTDKQVRAQVDIYNYLAGRLNP